MKIDEAVKKIIDETNRVRAKVDDNNNLIIGSSNRPYQDWFLLFPANATSWNRILEVWNSLDHVTAQDLARVMDVIQRLLDTPVEERFPEKKYRLVANPNSLEQTGTYATKYVACIQDGMDGFSFIYGGPTVFSEKELKQIEELHPNIAPAIDTMKEEVKDDEAN